MLHHQIVNLNPVIFITAYIVSLIMGTKLPMRMVMEESRKRRLATYTIVGHTLLFSKHDPYKHLSFDAREDIILLRN